MKRPTMELETHWDGVNKANSLVTLLQWSLKFVPPSKQRKQKNKANALG